LSIPGKLASYLHQYNITGTEFQTLPKLKTKMPKNINTELPTFNDFPIDWDSFGMSIDFANLPVQASIDLVSFLVLLQSGVSRFSSGVPTVGGRTRIGIVEKNEGFIMLDEPTLVHKYTGISDEL